MFKKYVFIFILLVCTVVYAARFGNISLNGNTIESLDTNGDIVISPNGTGDIDADTSKIINVTDPSSAQDAATMNYVDTSIPSDTDSLSEGATNLYYTEGRVTANTSVTNNTAKVTFPEAPNDGVQYARKSLGWEAVAGGGGNFTVVSIDSSDSPYTLTTATNALIVDGTSDDITINLYAVSGNSGETIEIKRTDQNYYDLTTFVDGDVTVGTDNINDTTHGLPDLKKVQLTSSGTLPAGLSLATDYWVIFIDSDNYKLASSRANAVTDTAVDITAAAGGGTHTNTPEVTTVTIDANAAEEIDGSLTKAAMTINESYNLMADGSNWFIRHHFSNTPWVTYVPVTNGLTVSAFTVSRWKRTGGNQVIIQTQATISGRTAVECQYGLPSSALTIDVDSGTTLIHLGMLEATGASVDNINVVGSNGDSFLNFTGESSLTIATCTAVFSASTVFSYSIITPVQEWDE